MIYFATFQSCDKEHSRFINRYVFLDIMYVSYIMGATDACARLTHARSTDLGLVIDGGHDPGQPETEEDVHRVTSGHVTNRVVCRLLHLSRLFAREQICHVIKNIVRQRVRQLESKVLFLSAVEIH